MFDIDKLANDLANFVKTGALTKENAEAVYEAACAKYDLDPETGKPIVQESDEDVQESEHLNNLMLINEFLEERALETMSEAETTAPAETNPATHVEDEIDEKLPAETPNKPGCIGCMKDVENTDKAIENAKKDLDVAGKLAEMKAAHEAEKDTTQQHETIKQALESEESDDVDLINITKLNIYESADAGLLTEEEKKTLLSMLEEFN